MLRLPAAVAAIALVLLLAVPAPALARDGDDVRVAGTCGRGASAELRLKADDGRIEVELRVRRRLPDFAGADQVNARASGPRGLTCQATAVLTES